jgi:hypothetical protein
MMKRREVEVAYHQLLLAPFGVSPIMDPTWSGDLLSVTGDGLSLIVVTGCAMGPVWVSVTKLDRPPAQTLDETLADARSGWVDGEEANLNVRAALHLTSALFQTVWEPVYEPTSRGTRRVRVVVKGRGAAPDMVVQEPCEEYELTIWPEVG